MMDNLYDVCNCLNAMDSSKVTERKKNVALLEQLLSKPSVTDVIDSNSVRETAGSRLVTWNVILKGVIRYIDTEIRTLQSAKGSQSSTALSNRKKKMQELPALFKLIIRTANKGSVKLNYQLLVDRIENMLMDEYTLESSGTDYCCVFLNYVLRVRQYWLEIRPDKWRKLAGVFCKLYDESKVDKSVLTWIIQEVIHGSCLQGEPYLRRIFTFFTKVLENVRNLRDPYITESILTSVNVFCETVAPNNRVQLCYFGESQMSGFFYLWNQSSSDKVKEELIKFFHLLLRAHHPNGATDSNNGAYAHNWDLWKGQVACLHEMLVIDIDKITDRCKFISGSKVCSPSYTSFAADVFKQVPVSKLISADLATSPSQFSQSGNHGDAGPAKRQRVSVENKSLLEIINDRSNTLQAVPWLQVLQNVLSKYPEVFGAAGLSTTLQVMTGLLAECKKGQLFRYIFEVLSHLIQAIQKFGCPKDQSPGGMSTLWSLCVSSINSRQAEVEGYQEPGVYVMSHMINANLVSPTKEIWNLFLPSFSNTNHATDHLLTSLITVQGLPENYVPSIVGAPLDNKLNGRCKTFPLRHSLITWLLPVADADSATQFKPTLSPVRLAEILHALTAQDPSVIKNELPSFHIDNSVSHPSVMESVYLKSTFDYFSKKSQTTKLSQDHMDKQNDRKGLHEHCPHIPGLLQFLVKQLFLLSNNIEQQNLEFLSWFSCLLARLIYLLWEESSIITNIQSILKKVLGKMDAILVSSQQKEMAAGLTSALTSLGAMLTFGEEAESRVFHVAEYIRSCLPGSFIDMLLDITSGKFNKRNDSRPDLSEIPGHLKRRESLKTRTVDVDREFDLFGMPGSSHASEDDTCHVEFDVDDFLKDVKAGEGTNKDIKDFLSKENLTEADQTQILACETLCRLTAYDRRQTGGSTDQILSVRTEMDMENVNSKLLWLISSECYDPSQAVCLHLLLTISRYFLTCDHEVTPKDIKLILAAFKQSAKVLVKDHQVCCQILSHLRYIIPHLSDNDDGSTSEELKYCRDVFFKFISDFWRLASDSTPRLKFEIAQTLLDLLKHDPNCTWGHLRIAVSDDEGYTLCTVSQHIPKLLAEGCIVLRTLVAESLQWLFVVWDQKGSKIFRDKVIQKKAFECMFEICSELLNIQPGNLSQQRWKDEQHNRQATCLQALMTIIIASPVCEKLCLLGLCQMVAERNIPLDNVRKMLNIICRELNFADIKSYLTCHLPYLIHNWLHQDMVNNSVPQFPYTLLGYTSLDQFVKSHLNLVVSELLITRLNIQDIHALLEPCHIDLREALVSSLPLILPHVLPAFAARLCKDSTSSENASSKSFATATDCFTLVVSELSEKTIKDCTYEKLGDIIVGILSCLNIEKHIRDGTSLSMVYPEPNPPHYDHAQIQITLDYLAQNFITSSARDKTTLISVLATMPGGLYQVLLSLSTLIWQEHRAHEQQRHLQMYRLFVNMLLKELAGGLEGGWASIIRDISNRLLLILTDRRHRVSITTPSYEEDVVLTTLDILRSVCSTALKICPEEMSKYVHRITDAVADTVSLSENIGISATGFLTTLLSSSSSFEHVEDLMKALRILNPLPETPGLSQLRARVEMTHADRGQALEGKLENLLEVCRLMSHNPSQGLAIRMNHLAIYIALRHGEVEKLVQTPEGALILKKVLFELIRMVTSPHQEVAVASASCLGAIGPIDLQSLSFPHQPLETSSVVASGVYKGHSFEKYCWLFHALDSCLLDKSLDVVKVAGLVLKNIMATGTGRRFQGEYSKTLKNKSFLFHYLHPFESNVGQKSEMTSPSVSTQASLQIFKMSVDKPELWLGRGSNSNTAHEDWIQDLTTVLLNTGAVQDEILKAIGPMCSLKSQFCEESLPFLIHDILKGGNEETRQVLSVNISLFFHSHCEHVGNSSHAADSVYMNKQSIRTMLNVVQYLRTQNKSQGRQKVPLTAWHNNFWLDLDYLQVARAAQYCSANFSAILFTEIWWEIRRNQGLTTGNKSSSQVSDPSQESQLDPLTFVSSQDETGQGVQELLLQVYTSIGDPDGIYGCGAGKLAQPVTRVQTYLHEQQQGKALTTLDIGVSQNTSSVSLLLQTVESCGADYILQHCLSELTYCKDGIPPPSSSSSSSSQLSSPSSSLDVTEELQEFYFQSAWRLGQWDVNLPTTEHQRPVPFHQSLYRAMASLKDGHLNVAKQALDMARFDVVKKFDPRVESCKSLYPFLSRLQCLTYLQLVLDILIQSGHSSSEELLKLFSAESDRTSLTTKAVHFEYEKSILEVMTSVARILTSKGSKQGETLQTRALWSLAVGGRKAKHFQLAEKALQNLKTQIRSHQSLVSPEHTQLEEAKLFWARSEVDIAKNVLKNLIGKLSKDFSQGGDNRYLYPEALCTYGNWLAETRSEAPAVIFREYLEKTVELMTGSQPLTSSTDYTALKGFVSLARFADEQYQQIADHLRSPIFEDKKQLLERLKSELKECQDFKTNSKYVKIMEKTLVLDHQEIKSLQESHEHFLLQALLNYLKCLRSGDVYNLKVFRVVALWFENSKNPKVNALIKEHIDAIRTYKFLPLYYQLAARMSSNSKDSSNFQPVLMQLMERVASDHPHHAVWIIMALAHAYKDDEFVNKQQATSAPRGKPASTDSEVKEERVQAAKCLLDKLHRHDKRLADIVTNMRQLCVAYIELANWTITREMSRNQHPQPLPKELAILRMADCDNIALPSVELKVDPTGTYEKIISPAKFSSTFRLAGGINLPKIITCMGSDGRERTQLVKGQDDLRQDAVMQQVFTLVNELLAGNEETRHRQLKIQTYKVIPLSQKCGLLQWCEGTKPLGEYLTGTNGAHSRYRPNDLPANQCRQDLNKAGNKLEQKLKAYQEICARFKPVFHHFFMENFVQPSVWFEKRLAYTRSVATNSIVGYILGLGDRHPANILIDLQSAEVIHIDLGIAFEQGRILPTPETVPFRLTRDIVDGMGITGVEGVFRRCCEKTMEVMKDNSESLLTIVQVLLYDPLSHWSLTPQQALAIQRKREQANLDMLDATLASSCQVSASGQIPSSGQFGGQSTLADRSVDAQETQNKLAERTLLRLRQKLSGQEEGVSLSVTGQVNLLIMKASDPQNLCMLFHGWQPYL